MQKISSILPSNNRISSVDLKEARPLRPGTPNYGEPVGKSEIVRFSKSALDAVKEGGSTRSKLDERNFRIADALAKKFFNSKNQQTPETSTSTDAAAQEPQPLAVADIALEDNSNEEMPSSLAEIDLGQDLFDTEVDVIERVAQPKAKVSAASQEDAVPASPVKAYQEQAKSSGSTVNRQG